MKIYLMEIFMAEGARPTLMRRRSEGLPPHRTRKLNALWGVFQMNGSIIV